MYRTVYTHLNVLTVISTVAPWIFQNQIVLWLFAVRVLDYPGAFSNAVLSKKLIKHDEERGVFSSSRDEFVA